MDLYPTTGPRYYTNQTQNVGVCKKKISCGRKQQELCLTEGWHYLVAGQLRPCRGFEQLRQPDTALTQSNYKSWGPITTALLRKMGGAVSTPMTILSPPLAMMSARLVINTMDMNTAFSIASIRLTYAPKDGRMRNGRPSQHTPDYMVWQTNRQNGWTTCSSSQ